MRTGSRWSSLVLVVGALASVPEASAAQLKRVQASSFTMLGGATVTTATLNPPIDTTKSFLVFGVEENATPPVDGQISGQITNATTITFQRAAGNAGNIRVTWWVAEFVSGVRVLHGSATLGPASPGDLVVPLAPAVDPRRSFPLISLRTSGSSYEGSDFARAEITGGGANLSLYLSNGINSPVAEWQVVEYTDAEVQSGTVTFANTDLSKTVTLPNAVNTAKSWLVYSYDCRPGPPNCPGGAPGVMGSRLVRGLVTNSTTLTFDRSLTTASAEVLNVAWYMVSFSDPTTVQHGSAFFAAGNNQVDIPISPVRRGASIAVAGGAYQRGGRSPYAGFDDHADVAWFAADMTGGVTLLNNLRFNRGFTGASADVGWFVVDFSCCAALTTVDAGTTLTVTAPNYFELGFNTATGGGIDQLYDLAEDPTKTTDLAGGMADQVALFDDEIVTGVNYYYPGSNPNGLLHLIEATPARAKVRQDGRYHEAGGSLGELAGVQGVGDYSIYPIGRMATRWNRKTTTVRSYTALQLNFNAHHQGAPPLNAWTNYSESGSLGGFQPGTDTFVLQKSDLPFARTDFLGILSAPWGGAHGAEEVFESFDALNQFTEATWHRYTAGSLPAGVGAYSQQPGEVWNILTYFKPTILGNFASPWLDSNVTLRQDDYQLPSATPAGPGAGWVDAYENTASDPLNTFFNEAEAAYVFDLNPATGLTFDMDGGTTTRYSPFFKIRQWRSFTEAPVVTLEGISLQKDLDYKAAVKPLARGYKTNALSWHCTIQDAAACDSANIDVGTGNGLQLGSSAIVPARYGNGLSLTTNDSYIVVPTNDFSFSGGALDFWYRPNYDSSNGTTHPLWNMIGGVATDYDCFWLEHRGGNLSVRAYLSANDENCNIGGSTLFTVTATAANYAWRAGDWVHIRTEWDASSFVRLYVDGRLVQSGGSYGTGGFSVGQTRIGSCQITCPGAGGSNNADGIIDEPHVFVGTSALETQAHAGLVGDAREFHADGGAGKNAALITSQVGPGRKGQYLYFGSDSRIRGLNMTFATIGAGVAPGALVWQYWRDNGAGTEGWADLEGVAGFLDGTLDFGKNGTLKWDADPTDWKPYSVSGGPDLYYVRVYLSGGVGYTPPAVERVIKTDILLFQYCKDVTAAAQTFAFAVPPTTEVKLASFTALPGDGSVQLEWRTASELSNLGFHLYRGPSENGPWTQINPSLIPGLGSSAVGQAYSFRDTGLANATRYFYRLEDVDASSKATSHGPVSAVPQAGAAAGSAPGSERPASGGGGDKKQDAAAASCPDWVLSAYASSVGADAATSSLRCTRHGDPEATSFSVLSRDSRSASVELRTGGFYALHARSGAGAAGGGVRVYVPGFDLPPDEQALALPMRRALVDAVVGRRVALGGVRVLDLVSFRGLVPSSLGRPEMQVGRDGTVRAVRRGLRDVEGARSRRQADGSGPRLPAGELVRLLPSVFQGEAKSAVVELQPLRFDERRGLVLAMRLRVKLLFTGREAGESGRGNVGRRERPHEPVTGELLARLYTTGRGLHAVSFEQLFPARQRGLAASQLRLERQAEPVSFHVEPTSESFGPGSVLYFHADTAASSTDFSSETAWELVRARDGLPMPLVSTPPAGGALTSASTGRASFETNRFYQPGLLEAPDLWLWEALGSGTTRTRNFSIGGVDAASARRAELEVFLQGASESGNPVDHHVSVSLNGTLVGEAQFAGKKPYRMSLSVPQSLLREGANELSLTNVADTGASSFVFLDRFTLAHPQASLLTGGRFEGEWSESGSVSLAGVSGALAVVDVTGPGAARWLTGSTASGGTLRFQVEAGHRYLAVSQEALLTPRVVAPAPSSLRSTQNQADYLLIAPRAFLASAEPLLQRRHDQGLATRAIAFEEISDEFGHGQPSAAAIKSFLAYAFQSWARPSPRYVLLLGDSTYDPRNFVGTSQASPLPALWAKTSYLWTASDPELAAVNGEDALPDLAIGRLPATTVEQAQRLVDKLIAWEDSGQSLSGAAALVADNPDLAGDFEADVEDIRASFLALRETRVLKLSELGAQTRPRVLDALNSGLSFLSYVGHGGAAVWASENVWNSWDAPSLLAQSQQPLLVTMNCLNGYFVAPAFDSLSESLLKAEGRGAIASFSPSGLSLDGPAHRYHRALMAELTGGAHARLGDAILAAQKTYADSGLMPELVSVYHLLGDPAMGIR